MDIDGEMRVEIIDAFLDLSLEIETALEGLIRAIDEGESEGVEEDINALFRAVHTIKGNAAVVRLESVMHFTNSIEEVIESLRMKRFEASHAVIDVIQLGIDRLRDIHQRDLFDQSYGNLQEKELISLYTNLSLAKGEEADQESHKILQLVGVGFAHDAETETYDPPTDRLLYDSTTSLPDHSKQAFDLLFFRELSQQTDQHSIYWEGRTEQSHDWAQKLNAINGSPVDTYQLSAAVYLHDIGMSFIPHQILEKKERLTIDELAQMRQHPVWGYNYLIRIEGWAPAASMILEHHERIDGKGYPIGNGGEIIHDGAKILAIIDSFFSILNGRADREKRKTVVRAMSEINSRAGAQFDQEWVTAFNEVVRCELKAGAL